MRSLTSPAVLTLSAVLIASPAFAAKSKGNTTLKDVQTAGMKDKDHKHQAYDLFFNAQGNNYTCRTDSNKSMNATDFVVGTAMKYELDGDKARIESPQGKKVECKVVRVEAATP